MYIPKIAVLIATYNGIEWIAEQIESIRHQTNVNVSLYFSDDQSTDGTKEFIEELDNNKIELTLLSSEVKFGSAGSNFLRLLKDVNISNFDYIAFSDQDDIWLENKLCEAINVIKLNEVDGYSGNVTAFWPDGTKKLIYKSKPQQKYDYMFESAGPGCTFVFTQKLAIELQRFLSSNQDACKGVALHDWFTYAYARSHGYKWFINSDSHVMYRQHEENVLGANSGFKAKVSRWKKMREGWYLDQILLLGSLLGYEDKFPITALKRNGFYDRLALIANVRKLRRRLQDCFVLAIFFVLPLKK